MYQDYETWKRKLLISFNWFDLKYLEKEALPLGTRIHHGSVPMKLNEILNVLEAPSRGGRGDPRLMEALRELTRAEGPFQTTITYGDGSTSSGRFWPMPPILKKKIKPQEWVL